MRIAGTGVSACSRWLSQYSIPAALHPTAAPITAAVATAIGKYNPKRSKKKGPLTPNEITPISVPSDLTSVFVLFDCIAFSVSWIPRVMALCRHHLPRACQRLPFVLLQPVDRHQRPNWMRAGFHQRIRVLPGLVRVEMPEFQALHDGPRLDFVQFAAAGECGGGRMCGLNRES